MFDSFGPFHAPAREAVENEMKQATKTEQLDNIILCNYVWDHKKLHVCEGTAAQMGRYGFLWMITCL